MIRLRNTNFARAIHQLLYERMVPLCVEYMPEEVARLLVSDWLNRLYSDDPSIHILINMNDENTAIVEHAVIEVQTALNGAVKIIMCHQCQHDKPLLSHIGEGIEYMDKLAVELNATCKMIYVSKHSKALEKKYGYHSVRTCMVKYD